MKVVSGSFPVSAIPLRTFSITAMSLARPIRGRSASSWSFSNRSKHKKTPDFGFEMGYAVCYEEHEPPVQFSENAMSVPRRCCFYRWYCRGDDWKGISHLTTRKRRLKSTECVKMDTFGNLVTRARGSLAAARHGRVLPELSVCFCPLLGLPVPIPSFSTRFSS